MGFWKDLLEKARPHLKLFDGVIFAAIGAFVVFLMWLRGDPALASEGWIRAIEFLVYIVISIIGVFVWATLKMEPELDLPRRRFLAGSFIATLFGGGFLGWLSSPRLKFASSRDLRGNYHRGKSIKLSDLVANDYSITGITFEECKLFGPMVFSGMVYTTIENCAYVTANADVMVIEIRSDQLGLRDKDGVARLEGTVRLVNCKFLKCELTSISFAAPQPEADKLRSELWS